MTVDKKALQEAICKGATEAARVVLVAVIPLTISMLESNAIDWRLLAVTGAIALLKFIDKALHKYGESVESTTLVKGLVRF
jgi:hypothetical protein